MKNFKIKIKYIDQYNKTKTVTEFVHGIINIETNDENLIGLHVMNLAKSIVNDCKIIKLEYSRVEEKIYSFEDKLYKASELKKKKESKKV